MTEEVRTTSSTGGEKGVKPERFSLLPKPALDQIARIYAYGEQKYAAHNWRKGYEWSKSYDALIRHLTAFWEGEDIDPESGLPHLASAGFHVMTLLTFMEEQRHFDDRYVQPELEFNRNESVFLITDPDLPQWTQEELELHESNRREFIRHAYVQWTPEEAATIDRAHEIFLRDRAALRANGV